MVIFFAVNRLKSKDSARCHSATVLGEFVVSWQCVMSREMSLARSSILLPSYFALSQSSNMIFNYGMFIKISCCRSFLAKPVSCASYELCTQPVAVEHMAFGPVKRNNPGLEYTKNSH